MPDSQQLARGRGAAAAGHRRAGPGNDARARKLASVSADPWMLSVARHAQGIVLRDQGRTARGRAASSGRPASSPGAAAIRTGSRTSGPRSAAPWPWTGRPGPGSGSSTGRWPRRSSPQVRARCLMRRGYVLSMVLGRHHDALVDLRGALRGVRALGDRIWEARTLNNMSLLHLDVGDVVRAERALATRVASSRPRARTSRPRHPAQPGVAGLLPGRPARRTPPVRRGGCRVRRVCALGPPARRAR